MRLGDPFLLVAAASVVCLLVPACAPTPSLASGAEAASAAPGSLADASPSLQSAALPLEAAPPALPTLAPSQPWRIVIPEIAVDAPVVAVGLEPDGAMGAPEGPFEVGWFGDGPVPGQLGNVLLDGHVDWTNRQTGRAFGAVFWRLARLPTGSPIYLTDGDTELIYTVGEKLRFAWDDPAGAEVLQPTGDARLTLITCGGLFDRATRNYSMRDVVIAYLAP